MTSNEMQLYRSIIFEQITLQELQAEQESLLQNRGRERNLLGLTRRIKEQRRLLSRMWGTAEALKKAPR